MSYNEALERLKFWFTKLDILSWWNKKVEELSKGMAQKIQFVVTVIHEPKLLIFDEPFSGFDPINAAIIRKEIVELSKKGTTIIFSTHRMESVEEICDHIALINRSKTILQGSIKSIKKQFTNDSYEIITKNAELENNDLYNITSSKEDTFHILLKEGVNWKNVLNYINTNYEIVSFKKDTPTMEEIFINAVKDA